MHRARCARSPRMRPPSVPGFAVCRSTSRKPLPRSPLVTGKTVISSDGLDPKYTKMKRVLGPPVLHFELDPNHDSLMSTVARSNSGATSISGFPRKQKLPGNVLGLIKY